MRTQGKRWAMFATGWLFLVLGIAGLVLPVLQGILFILIGLLILSSEYVWAHRLLEKTRQRFPTMANRAHSAAQRVHRWFHRHRSIETRIQTTPDGGEFHEGKS